MRAYDPFLLSLAVAAGFYLLGKRFERKRDATSSSSEFYWALQGMTLCINGMFVSVLLGLIVSILLFLSGSAS